MKIFFFETPLDPINKSGNIHYVPPEQYKTVQKTVESWETIAKDSIEKCKLAQEEACTREFPRLKDTILISSEFAKWLHEPFSRGHLYAYQKPSDPEPTGFMLLQHRSRCPEKARSPFFDPEFFEDDCTKLRLLFVEPKPSQGIGSHLLQHSRYLAQQLHREGVFLESFPSAEGFYKKKGGQRL